MSFADVEAFRNKLREKIVDLIHQKTDDKYKQHSNEEMLRILFEMIQQYGTSEEIEQFTIENLRFTFFREWYIHKLKEERNFRKIVDLALEGEAQDQSYPGLNITAN